MTGRYGFTADGMPHDFKSHVLHMLGEKALVPGQEQYGGYSFINDNYVVGRSTITGLRPVVEQAIAQVKAANPALSGVALEKAIANQLTNLNDWDQLTTETQNEIMILTGINFDGMTAQEQEETINHLLHSPLPFGDIDKVLSTSAKIEMGYTHTLDKNETTAEHMGNGIYKVYMVSNNNNGSHTGHNLGSFLVDMSGYGNQQYASAASASSVWATGNHGVYINYAANNLVGQKDGGTWYPAKADAGFVGVALSYASAVNATGIVLTAPAGYQIGQITKVEALDDKGFYRTVWEGDVYGAKGQDLTINFAETGFQTKDIRLTLDTSRSAGWEGIDAVKLLGTGGDGSGLESAAIEAGNNMVVNTNNNNELYLDQSAREVLYGQIEQLDFSDMEYHHNHGGAIGAGHHFVEHVKELFPTVLTDHQQEFGGYSYVNGSTIVARSTITGLKPVIEQAIAQVKAANPGLSGLALEQAIANQLTQLNDWEDLTEETQAELMIMTGYNFDGFTAQEREMTINHLLHSPLPFGEIQEVLSTTTTIDMGYTHTLDKTKTTAEHMGNGIYKVSMISNNNNGSHTGHNLGSFMIDVSGYGNQQYASHASASSTYGGSYGTNQLVGSNNYYGWFPASTSAGAVTIDLSYASAVNATGVVLSSAGGYQVGHVTKVEARDAYGVYHVVWQGDAFGAANQDLTINFGATGFQTKDIRVTLDTNRSSGWEGIDSVKLLGTGGSGAGLESTAIEIGNNMVQNTNDNNQLYLDEAARKILYGQEAENHFTVDNPYGGGHGGHGHGGHGNGNGNGNSHGHGNGNGHGHGHGHNEVNGTHGNDTLYGTDGNDKINGLGGVDVIVGSKGDDIIDGGDDGYNQVDYAGALADYTFTDNGDGTITVSHPENGTDTLSNIDGFWFLDEAKWYSLTDALAAKGQLGGTFTADPAGGFLSGTAGDDTFNGGAGNDVFYGGKGNDTFNGGGGDYNQVDLDGGKADYTFTKNADGTVTASSAEYGVDVLKDIDGVWFYGDQAWSSVDDLAA